MKMIEPTREEILKAWEVMYKVQVDRDWETTRNFFWQMLI